MRSIRTESTKNKGTYRAEPRLNLALLPMSAFDSSLGGGTRAKTRTSWELNRRKLASLELSICSPQLKNPRLRATDKWLSKYTAQRRPGLVA